MDFLKTVAGKVVGGIIGLVVVIAGISWFTMDGATKDMLLGGTGRILSWLGVVAIVPWAGFFLVKLAAKRDTNLAGVVLVAGLTLAEAVLLGWLFSWSLPNTTAWVFCVLGVLLAGAYNTLACDWIAEKL